MTVADNALEILNALAPTSRKAEWWLTDGPLAVIEAQLLKLYSQPNEPLEDRVMDIDHRLRRLEDDDR